MQSGGGHFTLGQNDDVNATFTRVMQELHYQYTLGFTPQKLDGKIHTLEVRVDRPGVAVRARTSVPRPETRHAAALIRPMRNRLFATTLAALVALAVPPRAQQASFRAATDLVSIYATVTDASGRLVPNLAQADFTVYDNGKKQPLSYFSNDRQPFTVVVMLDRSGSMAAHFDLIRDAGIAFVHQFLPDDRARIGSFGDSIVISPAAFTSDQNALVDVLKFGLQTFGASPVWTAIDRSITALLPEPGRRVVLAFTDGHDNSSGRLGFTQVDDLINRVRIDGVMVYAIGFSSVDSGSGPPHSFPPHGRWGPPGPRYDAAQWPASAGKSLPPDPGLKGLSDESGGGYFEMDGTDDLTATFTRVAEELHRQYLAGLHAAIARRPNAQDRGADASARPQSARPQELCRHQGEVIGRVVPGAIAPRSRDSTDTRRLLPAPFTP